MSRGKPVVSNSSPLIWLAKIGKLELLRVIFGEVVVPRRVYEETCRGGTADSILISRSFEQGWMKASEEGFEEAVVLAERAGIHRGEAEAILLAHKLGVELLIDEREGSVTAQMFGVKPVGTIAVLLLGLAKNHLSFSEFKECLDRLVASGFWLTVDVYNRVLEEAQSMAKSNK